MMPWKFLQNLFWYGMKEEEIKDWNTLWVRFGNRFGKERRRQSINTSQRKVRDEISMDCQRRGVTGTWWNGIALYLQKSTSIPMVIVEL